MKGDELEEENPEEALKYYRMANEIMQVPQLDVF